MNSWELEKQGPPQRCRVVLFLKHTRLVANDDAVTGHFLSHVGCVAGAI